ncbi:O-antigen ligase family protein [Vreelandella janggokensis]|uniref:O-antigen ligase family protein n=1 Tax=Vreelandella janggokensis TaxID=370767 RepID=UPI0028675A4B|nr:O-antigen ligase family protein [Halomonas janggokensis]MDR5886713.1 O-antigen ligase family protein [Halomonas janggokensis]
MGHSPSAVSYSASFSPFSNYTSLAVFLLCAIALVVPSGYSLGAVMLLLGSVVMLFKRPALGLNRQDALVMLAMAAYTLVGVLEAWWDGQGVSGMDKPLRFLLAIPALLLVMAYPPRLAWFWGGVVIGACTAGSWAAWQKLGLDIARATGHTHTIQFGNLSMLLGVLCLAGLGWGATRSRRHLWFAVFIIGALLGLVGSLFSGSRGGWVGLPFVLLVLLRAYGGFVSKRMLAGLVGLLLAGGLSVYAIPELGVQTRVNEAVEQVQRYASGDRSHSSVGARFEMWRGASHLIAEKPLTGWGDNGYAKGMQALADQGVINARAAEYGHAHNEFIDSFAKRGVIGLAVLLAVYLLPMRFFAKKMGASDLSLRATATAGVLLSVTYIDFSLTQGFLSHNSGVMMFAFLLAVLWGIYSRQRKVLGRISTSSGERFRWLDRS